MVLKWRRKCKTILKWIHSNKYRVRSGINVLKIKPRMSQRNGTSPGVICRQCCAASFPINTTKRALLSNEITQAITPCCGLVWSVIFKVGSFHCVGHLQIGRHDCRQDTTGNETCRWDYTSLVRAVSFWLGAAPLQSDLIGHRLEK